MKLSIEREPIQRLGLETESMSEIVNRRRRQEEKIDRMKRRSYQAAALNRLTRDWPTITRSQKTEVWRSLRILRARVRHLAHNNDYFKKFLSTVRNNVAGPTGIKLRHDLEIIQDAWKLWSNPENASVNRQASWTAILRRFWTTLARDGEVMVRMVVADNPFGFALKFIDVNWLDETFNTIHRGNRVIMSVELDANDVPVAYWLTPPGDEYSLPGTNRQNLTRTRIPADEIIHRFLPDDENVGDDTQTRGIPWAHTAMQRLHHLGALEEAAIVAARAGASKMGFFIPPAESDLDGDNSDQDPDNPEKIQVDHFQPGTFWELPPGYDYKAHDPSYPNADLEPLVKAMLRGAASGLDVSYNALANDGEGINYSTIRAFLVDEREIWRAFQHYTIDVFCRPVFNQWIKNATLTGAVPIRPRDIPTLAPPTWRPRGWKWVDPLKDIQASVIGINNGLTTITDELEAQGLDVREVFATRKKELDLAKELDIPLATSAEFKPVNLTEEDQDKPPQKKK
jgi:lambda family phage portal protein